MKKRGLLLIVDDDADMREALTMVLEEEGFEVAVAEDGQVALDKLASGLTPRLILLDLMMPRVDGAAFCRVRAEDPRLCAIPVVLLTADRDANPGALGAEGVLFKPVDLGDLLARLSSFVG